MNLILRQGFPFNLYKNPICLGTTLSPLYPEAVLCLYQSFEFIIAFGLVEVTSCLLRQQILKRKSIYCHKMLVLTQRQAGIVCSRRHKKLARDEVVSLGNTPISL